MPTDHPQPTPAALRETEIVGGIEWFTVPRPDGNPETDCQCARCGSSVESLGCWRCGGDGYTHHDCGEDTCCCLDPEDNVVCDACEGRGGSLHCLSTPAFCEANPLPGREHIKSTALEARAWNE